MILTFCALCRMWLWMRRARCLRMHGHCQDVSALGEGVYGVVCGAVMCGGAGLLPLADAAVVVVRMHV